MRNINNTRAIIMSARRRKKRMLRRKMHFGFNPKCFTPEHIYLLLSTSKKPYTNPKDAPIKIDNKEMVFVIVMKVS